MKKVYKKPLWEYNKGSLWEIADDQNTHLGGEK
jgi:hypothetical protein